MDNYDKWDESPNTAGVDDMGSSHSYTTITSGSANESIKSDFGSANVNHKYGTFEADYYTV